MYSSQLTDKHAVTAIDDSNVAPEVLAVGQSLAASVGVCDDSLASHLLEN